MAKRVAISNLNAKTIDILIQRSSASAFTGFIFAKPAQLSAEVTSTTLTTKMSNG